MKKKKKLEKYMRKKKNVNLVIRFIGVNIVNNINLVIEKDTLMNYNILWYKYNNIQINKYFGNYQMTKNSKILFIIKIVFMKRPFFIIYFGNLLKFLLENISYFKKKPLC